MPPIKRFRDTNPDCRMIQAWLILIGKARNRQTITYGDLSELMLEKRAPRSRAMRLGHLLTYCRKNNLPELPVIVVAKKTGIPAPLAPYPPDVANKINKVFQFDWYSVHPPTEADL
jgi:hypothetical protein